MIIHPLKLDFWIKNELNVLFVGKHGVGKTSIIVQAFEKNNLKWKYYSAATMDPWVDFIGVPREQKDENNQSYLDLVRPVEWQHDTIEALFFDELNRSAKKIRNAVMELIQFKSINGKKFKNLKIIWAAINPEDDEDQEYDVEQLDPAQEDRFHIKIEIPYKPDAAYFKNKYDESCSDAAIDWWTGLPKEMKNIVSPRRLDYALTIYKLGGDLRDVLPSSSNVSKLINLLSIGSVSKMLKEFANSPDEKAKYDFFLNENNFEAAYSHVLKQQAFRPLIKYFPLEKISSCIQQETVLLAFVLQHIEKEPIFQSVVKEIINAGKNIKFIQILKRKNTKVMNFLYPPNQVVASGPTIGAINSFTIVEKQTPPDKLIKDLIHNPLKWSKTPQTKVKVLSDVFNNIPCAHISTSCTDAAILVEVLRISNGSNRSTLQKFGKELPEILQFLMDRIMKTEDIRAVPDLRKLFRKDTLHKQLEEEIEVYRDRRSKHYSDFLPEFTFKFSALQPNTSLPIKTTQSSNIFPF